MPYTALPESSQMLAMRQRRRWPATVCPLKVSVAVKFATPPGGIVVTSEDSATTVGAKVTWAFCVRMLFATTVTVAV